MRNCACPSHKEAWHAAMRDCACLHRKRGVTTTKLLVFSLLNGGYFENLKLPLFRAKVSYRLMYILHESAMTPTHSSLGTLNVHINNYFPAYTSTHITYLRLLPQVVHEDTTSRSGMVAWEMKGVYGEGENPRSRPKEGIAKPPKHAPRPPSGIMLFHGHHDDNRQEYCANWSLGMRT